MNEFDVDLHPDQAIVFNDPARFKIVTAGRRWGKSRLALYMLFVEALKSQDADVYYIAPTFEQAKRIMFKLMKQIGRPIIKNVHENTAVITLANDRQIFISGSDRPDTLRGVPMATVVLDEYAAMKPMVWEEICRPALIDSKGSALFIGTPQGKNHFYDLFCQAQEDEEWSTYQFKSIENPFLDKKEVEKSYKSLSSQVARQELEASFESFNAGLFKEEWIKYGEKFEEGDWYIVADLAGFEATSNNRGRSTSKLDETAIWAVQVSPKGWFLGELQHGRWNIRETSVRLLRLAQEKNARCIAIEKGSLLNAVIPYMEDQMRRIGFYPRIEPVSHGGKSKVDRVIWALQGRFERGVITLKKADWNNAFITQLMDFPNRLSHDDLVDALAYTDQVAITNYDFDYEMEDYEPFDLVSGY